MLTGFFLIILVLTFTLKPCFASEEEEEEEGGRGRGGG